MAVNDAGADDVESAETVPVTAEPVEPVERVEPVGPVEPAALVEPVEPAGPVEPAEPVAPVETADPTHRVVYVEAPQPPREKGNRGFGVLLAILATIGYALVYAGILFVINLSSTGIADFAFISTAAYLVPIAYFAVGFIVLALIANRASWWAYVVGSLLVAAFVYIASVGTLVLINGIVLLTPDAAGLELRSVLVSPGAFLSALLAREVALWIGAVVASRGRKVKARNVVARDAFDAEVARERAERDTTLATSN